MSLMQRVQEAAGREPRSRWDGGPYAELKRGVQEALPSDRLAKLIERNPAQAKSEIRLACEAQLKEKPWLVSSESQAEEMVERFLDSIFGLGPLEGLLEDESVTEVMVNGTDSIYFEREGVLCPLGRSLGSDEEVLTLIDKIISPLGRRIDESSPMVNARLAQGHRVNAIIAPLAVDGPVLTIRKFREKTYTLEELCGSGSLEPDVARFLEWAVLSRKNIAVIGGTGSGKTTLLNALSVKIPATERIITIEDSAELRFREHPHVVRLEARPMNAEGVGEVTIKDLVVNALRMRPDRIVVGECRGAEALDMLTSMNTGHDGSLTTLHANSPKEAVSRLTTLVRYGAELPVEVIEAQIADAIDLIVETSRVPGGGRRVDAVASCHYDEGSRRCEVIECYRWMWGSERGEWKSVPDWVLELSVLGQESQEEVERWMERTR